MSERRDEINDPQHKKMKENKNDKIEEDFKNDTSVHPTRRESSCCIEYIAERNKEGTEEHYSPHTKNNPSLSGPHQSRDLLESKVIRKEKDQCWKEKHEPIVLFRRYVNNQFLAMRGEVW